MKISFSLKNIAGKFKKNISMALWAVLIILFLLEAWVVKSSIQGALASRQDTAITQARLVRVNFSLYDSIIKRLNDAVTYKPQVLSSPNPFGVNDKPANSNTGQ